jgi:hypothetical protein
VSDGELKLAIRSSAALPRPSSPRLNDKVKDKIKDEIRRRSTARDDRAGAGSADPDHRPDGGPQGHVAKRSRLPRRAGAEAKPTKRGGRQALRPAGGVPACNEDGSPARSRLSRSPAPPGAPIQQRLPRAAPISSFRSCASHARRTGLSPPCTSSLGGMVEPPSTRPPPHDFYFTRAIYSGVRVRPLRKQWGTDYPKADNQSSPASTGS